MPLPDESMSWWMTLSAVGVIALAAFLVSWLLTDVARVPRPAYLGALMVATAALTWGYLAWTGTDATGFVVHHWGWGVLGAVASGCLGAVAISAAARRRGLPRPARRRPAGLTAALLWEGILYGAAEGLLLSVLPVLAAWQSFSLLGWTDTTLGSIGSGALALAASVLVIWVHHLGYREFRRTREIVTPIVGCGVLSVAYLLTASPIAPVGGHVLLHAGMIGRGVPMPPYSRIPEQRPPQLVTLNGHRGVPAATAPIRV